MVIAVIVLVALVVTVVRLARRRRSQLAGLSSSRPTFTVSPPTRHIGKPGRF